MSIATLAEVRQWLGLTAPYDATDTFVIGILMSAVDRKFADYLGFSIAEATRTEFYPARVNISQRDQLVDGYERAGNNKVVSFSRGLTERRIIALRHLPVTAIVSVYENPDAWLTDPPTFDAEHLLTAGTDYYLDQESSNLSATGFLVRSAGPWSTAERGVKVTYTAGYTAEQLGDAYANLKHAYLLQIQIDYNTRKIHTIAERTGGMPGILASESLGDWSASYDTTTNAALYGLANRIAPAVGDMLEDYINYGSYLF